ncbi:MAG: hypothetical protein JW717_06145 [Marinilabiliaceae bacterium]|nr:hypothetical protein [Marinilabiliaceae bacterium]
MSAFVIFLLVLTGLILLILEFFVFPGITIAGVGGVLAIGLGIFFTYKTYGSLAGHITVFGTIVLGVFLVYFSIRNKTWNKMALNTTIDSKIETVSEQTIHIGDKGVSISRLNPIGKARFNDEIVEAHCPGHFIDENKEIEVVKVFKTHIIVKPL